MCDQCRQPQLDAEQAQQWKFLQTLTTEDCRRIFADLEYTPLPPEDDEPLEETPEEKVFLDAVMQEHFVGFTTSEAFKALCLATGCTEEEFAILMTPEEGEALCRIHDLSFAKVKGFYTALRTLSPGCDLPPLEEALVGDFLGQREDQILAAIEGYFPDPNFRSP